MQMNFKIGDIRYDIDGNLNDVIAKLSAIKNEYEAEGYSNLSIDISPYDDYGSAAVDVELYGWREETADEIAIREAREISIKTDIENRERAQFEALKAKFGDAK